MIPKTYYKVEDNIPFDLELKENIIEMGGRRKTKIIGSDWNFACCDCGLVHNIVIFPSKNKVKIIMQRDNRRTGQVRRYNDYKEMKG